MVAPLARPIQGCDLGDVQYSAIKFVNAMLLPPGPPVKLGSPFAYPCNSKSAPMLSA